MRSCVHVRGVGHAHAHTLVSRIHRLSHRQIFEYYQPWEVDRYDEYCQILQRHVAALAAYDRNLVFPIWYGFTPMYAEQLSVFLRYNISADIAEHYRPTTRKGKPLHQLHELQKSGISQRPSWPRLQECMGNLSQMFDSPFQMRLNGTLR